MITIYSKKGKVVAKQEAVLWHGMELPVFSFPVIRLAVEDRDVLHTVLLKLPESLLKQTKRFFAVTHNYEVLRYKLYYNGNTVCNVDMDLRITSGYSILFIPLSIHIYMENLVVAIEVCKHADEFTKALAAYHYYPTVQSFTKLFNERIVIEVQRLRKLVEKF